MKKLALIMVFGLILAPVMVWAQPAPENLEKFRARYPNLTGEEVKTIWHFYQDHPGMTGRDVINIGDFVKDHPGMTKADLTRLSLFGPKFGEFLIFQERKWL